MRNGSLLHAVAWTTLLFMATAAGCALEKGYHGSAAGPGLAVVRGHGVFLRRSNGIELSKASSGVLIAPGPNEIEFVIDPSTFNSRRPDEQVYAVKFTARADRDYVITGRRGDARLCVWPVNPDNGEPDFSAPAGCAVLSNLR